MTTEKYLDPPPFIEDWENDDESTWPKPPECIGDDVDYYSFFMNNYSFTRTRIHNYIVCIRIQKTQKNI